jgi:hypothetical protein
LDSFSVILSSSAYANEWNISKNHSTTYAKLKSESYQEAVFRCKNRKDIAVAFEIKPPNDAWEDWKYSLVFNDGEKFEGIETISNTDIFIEVASDKLFDEIVNNYGFTFSYWKKARGAKEYRKDAFRNNYQYSPNEINYSWRDILQECNLR